MVYSCYMHSPLSADNTGLAWEMGRVETNPWPAVETGFEFRFTGIEKTPEISAYLKFGKEYLRKTKTRVNSLELGRIFSSFSVFFYYFHKIVHLLSKKMKGDSPYIHLLKLEFRKTRFPLSINYSTPIYLGKSLQWRN